MLLPFWWSIDSHYIGIWCSKSMSSWINVEPEIDTHEGRNIDLFKEKNMCFNQWNITLGRLLFVLQILSFISLILTNIAGLLCLFAILRRTYQSSSLFINFSLLFLHILLYFILSTLLFFVWYSIKTSIYSIEISYSFYLTIFILFLHTFTLISLTINLAKYRTIHHTIQPNSINEKLAFAFTEPIVWYWKIIDWFSLSTGVCLNKTDWYHLIVTSLFSSITV